MRANVIEEEKVNAGEMILGLAKKLRFFENCNCAYCQDKMQHYLTILTPEDVELAKKFLSAPLKVQFVALFEDWTLDKISLELNNEKTHDCSP